MGDGLFDERKARALAALASPAPDLSPKGNLDAPIYSLVTFLNQQPDVFTTSSCSGRVSLFEADAGGAPKGGVWLYCSHERADADAVEAALAQSAMVCDTTLRFEPFICTLECRSLEAAAALLRSCFVSFDTPIAHSILSRTNSG